MLEVRNVTKIYNPGTLTEQRLFEDFSLTVEDGQFVAIVGSNGSGKTSLLNIICGSIPIEGGDVLVGGTSISRLKDYQRYATMGRVYQDPAAGTCPNLTMLENLSLADNKGRPYGLGRGVNKKRIDFYRQQLSALGLGLEDKLAGIEAKADTRPIYALSAPELLELPSVGTAKEFDLEGCAALEPDLVILPLKLQASADTLEELGIDALVVNPENQELLGEAAELIGAATNTAARAKELLAFTAEQEERLTKALEGAETPSVYLAGNSDFLSTAGSAMYQSAMIEMAGGANAAAEITDTYWAEVSYEQILAWNPQYIVLASDASYTVEDVLADPNLEGCAAVENGNVIQIPGDAEAWDSPVPGGILGAVWLSSELHPEECPQADSEAVIHEFYETFYGFSYGEN